MIDDGIVIYGHKLEEAPREVLEKFIRYVFAKIRENHSKSAIDARALARLEQLRRQS